MAYIKAYMSDKLKAKVKREAKKQGIPMCQLIADLLKVAVG